MASRRWWTAAIYVAAIAMVLRFYDLGLKPLHHDEGVNTLFLTTLVQPGHAYTYDPANYHGPTLYYFGWLSAEMFGLTTVAVRIVTAVAGLLTVLLLLGLKRPLGPVASMCAAALLTVSPGAVYFSRYYIHEMLLVCCTLAAVVSAWAWWRSGRAVALVGAGASAGLMFATKETAIVSAAVMGGAALGTLVLMRPGADPAAPTWRSRRPSAVVAVSAAAAFVAVALLFFTSLFTHWQGALDAVRAFAIWTKTGTSAHTHPWTAYARWLSAEEMPILVAGVAGIAAALWRRNNSLALFAALWAIGMLLVYSAIPYKTPWLVLNLIVPLAITAGYACEVAWEHRGRMPRWIPVVVFAAMLGVSAFQAVVLSFVEYDSDRHPYVYAHTYRDILRLVDDVEAIEAQHPRTSIAVTSNDHFPLSWYLRGYPTGYYGREVVTGDPLVIASVRQQPFFDRSLGGAYDRVGVYRLRPGVRLVLYARRDFRR